MKTVITVQGMTCDHCKRSVTRALMALEGVSAVEVDLQTKQVAVEHDAAAGLEAMLRAVDAIGFQASEASQ
jgi:copper chaperone CopZ